MGLTHQLRSQWARSENAFREALASTASNAIFQKFRAEALQGIGVARLELGKPAEAEDWLRQADESARKTFVGMTPLRADITMNLGRTLLAHGLLARGARQEARVEFTRAAKLLAGSPLPGDTKIVQAARRESAR